MGNITQHGKRQRPADPYPDCPFPTLPPVDDWTRSFHGMPSGKLKTKSLPDDPLEAEYAQFALDCGITAALRFSSAAMENQVLEFLKEHQDSSKAPLFEQPPLVVKPLLSKDSGDQSVPSSTAMDTVVSEPEKKEIPVALAPVYQLPKEFISSLTPFYSVDTVSGPLDSASIPHFALFALANLPPAYFVCTVGGTLTTKLDMPSGLLNIKNISASTELLPPFTKTVVDSWILDSRLFAGPLQDGRFVRSSCSSETPPNARLVIFSVQNETLLNGCLVIGLVTTKEVSVGDEIVLECAEGWAAYPCACSDISCCLLAGEARDALTETLQMEIEERKEAQDEAAHQIAKERREARKQTEKLAKVKTPLPDFLRKIVLAHKKRQALRQRREGTPFLAITRSLAHHL